MKKKRIYAALMMLALLLSLAGCGAERTGEYESTDVRAETEHGASGELSARENLSAPTEAEQDTDAAQPLHPSEEAPHEEAADASKTAETEEIKETEETGEAPRCTISISCAALLARMEELESEKAELVPADGVLLPPLAVEFSQGESVFDLLRRVCREEKIHMEFSETPLYQSAYVEGIGNLYEFDCGDGSGWMYSVNGVFPNYGCSRCPLADGDRVEWVYTCDFGADVGGSLAGE